MEHDIGVTNGRVVAELAEVGFEVEGEVFEDFNTVETFATEPEAVDRLM